MADRLLVACLCAEWCGSCREYRATFAAPQNLSEGVETVWVNGEKVWESGKTNGNLPGEILRRK